MPPAKPQQRWTAGIRPERKRQTSPGVAVAGSPKIALLERALDRYQAAIEIQRRQIADEQKRRQEQEAMLKALQAEIEMLRKAVAPK